MHKQLLVFHKYNCCVDSAMGCAVLLSRHACIKGFCRRVLYTRCAFGELREAGGIYACMQLRSGILLEKQNAMHLIPPCNRGLWALIVNLGDPMELATGYRRSHNADECKGLCGSLHMSSAASIAFAACSISHPCLCYLGVTACNAALHAAAPRRPPSATRVG